MEVVVAMGRTGLSCQPLVKSMVSFFPPINFFGVGFVLLFTRGFNIFLKNIIAVSSMVCRGLRARHLPKAALCHRSSDRKLPASAGGSDDGIGALRTGIWKRSLTLSLERFNFDQTV